MTRLRGWRCASLLLGPAFVQLGGVADLRRSVSLRASPSDAPGYGNRVFEDLFGEDEDLQSELPPRVRKPEARSGRAVEDMEFDPAEWDDLEVDEEDELEEEELPGEEELMQTVEVSDDEVDEFLEEFNSQPMVHKEPDSVPLDPFGKDAAAELDTFQELRSGQRQMLYTRGLQHNQMVITLRDRLRMLSEHADRGEWKEARYLMKGIWRRRHLRLPLGRRMWNQMIKAHVNANRPKAAESWLKDMLTRIFQPDLMSYNTLLRGYGRRGDFLKAEYWMRRMRARGVAPDMFSYGALVQSYVEAKDLPGAERALQSMLENVKIKRSNTFAYNTLLKHYASEAQVEKAESLLEKMQEDGVTPDGTTYLQMIRVAGATGDTEGAAEWLKRLEQQGEAIWEAHFHAVMSGHAKLGDMEGAEAWFRAMLDAGFRPDLVSFNILMSAAASGGDTGGAEGVLLRMADVEVAPDVVTFGTMLSAFAKVGNATGATQWLLEAEELGIEPDLNCYKQVIKACAQSGDADLAQRLARRLLRNRLTPDVYTYNMLLNALAKAGDWSNAEFWVDHLQRTARWRHNEFPLEQVSLAYSEVLLAHVAAGNLQAAEGWLQQMMGDGLEPQARCYSALVQGYKELGEPEQAGKWLARMSTWSNHEPPQKLLEGVDQQRLAVR